jgi:hypothetical protein
MTDDGSNSEQEQRRASSPRSKRIVCTSCRQSKVGQYASERGICRLYHKLDLHPLQVRCIGSENGSCERCTRLELDCNRDPRFKRVSKNRYVMLYCTYGVALLKRHVSKIAELEKQVQLLASAVNTRGQSTRNSQNYPSHPILSNKSRSPGRIHDDLAGQNSEIQSNAW